MAPVAAKTPIQRGPRDDLGAKVAGIQLMQPPEATVAQIAKDISHSPFGANVRQELDVDEKGKGFIALGNAVNNLSEKDQDRMLGLLNTSQVDVDAGARNGLARAKAHGLSIDMSTLGEHFNRLGAGKASKFIEKCLSDTSAGADPTKTLFQMLAVGNKQK